MKNLEEKIKILNQNRLENSLYNYVYCESQSDPNFFRWLFGEEFEKDFDCSLSKEQKEEFENWLEELKKIKGTESRPLFLKLTHK
jgi:subtilase family serine protease